MPDISQCSTGRKIIMKSGSPEGSANSSYISRSKLTGRMLYFKGVGRDIDTYVYMHFPDNNYCRASALGCNFGRYNIETNKTEQRILIKAKEEIGHYIHLYCYYASLTLNCSGGEVEIYEINPSDFEICKVTWNNQPSLGTKIGSFIFNLETENTWVKIPMGLTGAVMLKGINPPSPSKCIQMTIIFRSNNYSDKDYRPYFTDE